MPDRAGNWPASSAPQSPWSQTGREHHGQTARIAVLTVHQRRAFYSQTETQKGNLDSIMAPPKVTLNTDLSGFYGP